MNTRDSQKAWVITGPTSGIGHETALALAHHGTVVLVGRDPGKLANVKQEIQSQGGSAATVLCDISDISSAQRAADDIASLDLNLGGVLNNAGVMGTTVFTSAQGWDGTFATNHLGPFAFTEALVPHLPDGAHVAFICSAVEDAGRLPAVFAGFRGARYKSAEATARAEFIPGGSKMKGFDAYATSKQCNLATVLAFARQTPRLRFSGIEPGINPGTSLSRDSNAAIQFISQRVVSPIAPHIKYWSNPETASAMISDVLTRDSKESGTYFNEKGKAMLGSAQIQDTYFQDRVVAETRALLASAGF